MPPEPPTPPPPPIWWKPWTWQLDWRERSATAVILFLLALGVSLAWLIGPTLAVLQSDNPNALVPASACVTHQTSTALVKVSSASGPTATLNVFIGRGGGQVQRQTSPLTIQSGSLPPGTALCTSTSDFVRADGEALPSNQVASWARVSNDGTHVTIYVVVAPRYRYVSGFGGYTGTVSLDDSRAVGANVPVDVHVEYYDIAHPVAWALVAAFGGFVWAWFIHRHLTNPPDPQPFWASLTLRVAVLLVATGPVVNAQVLSNPDWEGSLSQYITLASLAGAAAIAAAPTFRVITSRGH